MEECNPDGQDEQEGADVFHEQQRSGQSSTAEFCSFKEGSVSPDGRRAQQAQRSLRQPMKSILAHMDSWRGDEPTP